MITKSVEFVDFNGNPTSKLMHFHISKNTLFDNIAMEGKLTSLSELLGGEEVRTLSVEDIKQLLDMVKWFMSISYGVKSDDGQEFDQDRPAGSGEIWRRFQNSAAYDALLMSFFDKPESLVTFIVGVLPEDLREGVDTDNPELLKAIEAAKTSRPAPGSRINEAGIVRTPEELRHTTPVSPEEMAATKEPIQQSQYDFMARQLNARQLEDFMSTRYIVGDEAEKDQ